MIKGFFIGAGFFMALVVFILFLALTKKLRLRRPTVLMWREYRKKAINAEQYTEVSFVDKLIWGREDHEKTPLPKGYKIEEKSRTILNDRGGDEVSVRVDKEYWIVKVNPRK